MQKSSRRDSFPGRALGSSEARRLKLLRLASQPSRRLRARERGGGGQSRSSGRLSPLRHGSPFGGMRGGYAPRWMAGAVWGLLGASAPPPRPGLPLPSRHVISSRKDPLQRWPPVGGGQPSRPAYCGGGRFRPAQTVIDLYPARAAGVARRTTRRTAGTPSPPAACLHPPTPTPPPRGVAACRWLSTESDVGRDTSDSDNSEGRVDLGRGRPGLGCGSAGPNPQESGPAGRNRGAAAPGLPPLSGCPPAAPGPCRPSRLGASMRSGSRTRNSSRILDRRCITSTLPACLHQAARCQSHEPYTQPRHTVNATLRLPPTPSPSQSEAPRPLQPTSGRRLLLRSSSYARTLTRTRSCDPPRAPSRAHCQPTLTYLTMGRRASRDRDSLQGRVPAHSKQYNEHEVFEGIYFN